MNIIESISLFEILLRHQERPPLHMHENHEFFLCVDGEGEQHTEAGVAACGVNELFFFPEGQRHIGNGSRSRACRAIVLNVTSAAVADMIGGDDEVERLFESLKNRALKGGNRVRLDGAAAKLVRSALTSALEELKGRAIGSVLAIKIHLQQFFLALLRSKASGAPRPVAGRRTEFSGERIEKVCKYLEENYMCQIDVDQAARLSGMSRSHFHTAFRRATGHPLVAHLTSLRVAAATKMLAESELPTAEVARLCGFDSTSRFYAVMKKATGKNPRELRGGRGNG